MSERVKSLREIALILRESADSAGPALLRRIALEIERHAEKTTKEPYDPQETGPRAYPYFTAM